jgi:hypothetical protein
MDIWGLIPTGPSTTRLPNFIWSTKRGITLVRIVKNSSLSSNLDIPKTRLDNTSSFNPTFRSQVITRKPIRDGRTDWRTTPTITRVPFDEASWDKETELITDY